jgi:hypothetical protein
MGEKKRYEILESLPVYGPMYISITGNDEPYYSQGFAVRFCKSNGSDWVANFKPGWTGFNAVYDLERDNNILVIAGGTCYLMDAENEKPKETFGVGYVSAIKTFDGRIILQDLTDLTIIEPNGEHWHTERISWDGIKDLKLDGKLVIGLSFDPIDDQKKWVEFIVDLEKRNIKGGSYRRYEFKQLPNVESKRKQKNPWWKIW